jgi:putative ATP-dependent endonuclease of the OLD family
VSGLKSRQFLRNKMAKIHNLNIKNFRGIGTFSHTFNDSNLICLIGRGDSGKSTILEAIYSVLSPQWNHTFHDGDFHNGNHESSIEIEITLLNIPANLLNENKFGLYIRGFKTLDKTLHDEIEDDHEQALTIKLEVEGDLEPHWFVINERQEPKPISANDRAMFNVCYVSDFIDRHFSWNKGNPLYTLLGQFKIEGTEKNNVVLNALRDAKKIIDETDFEEFDEAIAAIKERTADFGLDIANTSTSIDFKDILSKDGRFSLHDQNIPFRLKGKGSKRLISIAIQTALCKSGGIILIDELEQSLEPDRAQHTANILTKQTDSQIFLTTHSSNVMVELKAENLLLLRKSSPEATMFSAELQGCLRRNPEAFFANQIIVCEGATEIGIGRALNRFRTDSGKASLALKGVSLADGTGSTLIQYSKGFAASNFKVCLFCDSDIDSVNDIKQELKDLGLRVIDWEDGNSLEEAIMINFTFKGVRELLELASVIKSEEKEMTLAEAKISLWESVRAKFGENCPDGFKPETDSVELRRAIGKAAKSNSYSWFKTHTNGEAVGEIIFNNYDHLENNALKQQLDALSNWIDGN